MKGLQVIRSEPERPACCGAQVVKASDQSTPAVLPALQIESGTTAAELIPDCPLSLSST